MISCLRQTPKGVFLHVRASPKSGRNEISAITEDGSLMVKVTALPDKGKANEAVIETLAKTMRVAKSSFHLASGETQRNKVLRIDANQAMIEKWLMDFTTKQA